MNSPARAILIGGEKGGTGKSTIALNLAVMLRRTGADVHVIDCDRQQTALKFANRRAAQALAPALVCTHLMGDQLQVPITDLAGKYEAVVIDCGGQDSVELRAAMITPAVSLMIIPIQPGYFDLETLVTMDALVRTSKIYNPRLEARCLISRASTHKFVTAADEARAFIDQELEHLGLFETIIHDRVSYSYAAARGQGVIEYERQAGRDGKAAQEMINLFREASGREFAEHETIDISKAAFL
jgi:chromosome partitioning protein